jgi:hypothetical protein
LHRSLLIGLTAVVSVPGAALACTPAPAPPPFVPPAEARAKALAEARTAAEVAASPLLATRVRDAADISIATIDGYEGGEEQDIPPQYRERWGWYAEVGRLPVRYRFKTERVLKGTVPAVFPLKFDLPIDNFPEEWAWATLPDPEDLPYPAEPRDQAFWSSGSLELFSFASGPGDCSVQVALDVEGQYLVMRAADGKVLVIEPLTATDPLPDRIAAFIADPSPDYLWRPTVQEFLDLPGHVARVRVKDCSRDDVQIVEELRAPPDGYGVVGRSAELYGLAPSLRVTQCKRGAEYLMTGWPRGERLHPIVNGIVHFEDRWMQVRFTGDKAISIDAVRAILSGSKLRLGFGQH